MECREFESQPGYTKKNFKNGNRYTNLSTKLESDIDKPKMWLSSGQMFVNDSCVQMGK